MKATNIETNGDPEMTVLDVMNLRWYKGSYKVRIIIKGTRGCGKKGPVTYQVECLEDIPFQFPKLFPLAGGRTVTLKKGETFITIPRLLWTHPKTVAGEPTR